LSVAGVLADDADGRNAAPVPVSVAVLVVGFAGPDVVAGSVDLDDRGAAVTDHDEIGVRTPASRSLTPGSGSTAKVF